MIYAGTIERALSRNPMTRHYFRDVVPANQLPAKRDQHGIYVVNTHPDHMPGEHWVTVEYGPTYVSYFDSYGQTPHPRIKKELLRTGALRGKKLLYSLKRLQGYRHTCGLYCIYHVLSRTSGQHTMNIFNTDLDFNDRLVHKLVSQRFDVQ